MSQAMYSSRRDEKALILAAREGDDSALMELIDAHRDKIKWLVQRVCGVRELDPDLYQDAVIAFIEVVASRFRIGADNSLWTYAEHVLTDVLRMKMRSERRHRGGSSEIDASEPITSEELPELKATEMHTWWVDVHRYLGGPPDSTKWMILFALRNGGMGLAEMEDVREAALLHVRTTWEAIAEDLQDSRAGIGISIRGNLTTWSALSMDCGFGPEIPHSWVAVVRLFYDPEPPAGQKVPQLTPGALKQFYSRSLRQIRDSMRRK